MSNCEGALGSLLAIAVASILFDQVPWIEKVRTLYQRKIRCDKKRREIAVVSSASLLSTSRLHIVLLQRVRCVGCLMQKGFNIADAVVCAITFTDVTLDLL